MGAGASALRGSGIMTYTGREPHTAGAWGTSWWQSVLLGLVFILGGLFVLRNSTLATVVSAVVFGAALLVVGLFEIIQAFWAPHWSGVVWRLLVGALYAIGGAALATNPVAASVLLTLVFAAALIASGVARSAFAFAHWDRHGWLLLLSGLVGVLAGLVILFKWPLTGLWVFGLAIGLDVVLHRLWWVVSGLTTREEAGSA